MNQRIDGVDRDFEGLRPDLVIRHEPSKSIVIVYVTIPSEHRREAMWEARERKLTHYAPLAEDHRAKGYRVAVHAIVVGALGSRDPSNEEALGLLNIGSRYVQLMHRLMVSETIRWSRDIYVEYVPGARQYRAPSTPQ